MIQVGAAAVEAMWNHALFCHPQEACGLLAGSRSTVSMVYCLANVAAAPDRYTVEPGGHLGALRHAERNGWELIGVFHSHPQGPPVPSDYDIKGALEPAWHYVILGLDRAGHPVMRSYRIRSGEVTEEPIVTGPLPSSGCN